MIRKHVFLLAAVGFALVLTGAWAVENRATSVSPADFDTDDSRDYPQTNVIDLDVVGLARFGEVFMLEGIENTTFGESETTYPNLVLHGVFDEMVRDWRDDVINGKIIKRDIELDLRNQSGSRVLRVTFFDVFPIKFSLPVFSVDSSTRYMERLEFDYSYFEITNS